MQVSTGYHDIVMSEELMVKVDCTAALVKEWIEKNGPITHLVCSGVSGQAVTWPVAYKLGIPVCVVRKSREESHDGNVSGSGDLRRYLIIDDFIFSGATIRRIINQFATRPLWMADASTHVEPECAGIVLYGISDRFADRLSPFEYRGRVIPEFNSMKPLSHQMPVRPESPPQPVDNPLLAQSQTVYGPVVVAPRNVEPSLTAMVVEDLTNA